MITRKKIAKRMAFIVLTLILIFPSLYVAAAETQAYSISSPNGRLTATVFLDNGELYYKVEGSGNSILEKSRLGIKTSFMDFYSDMVFVSAGTSSWDNTYTLPSGKKSEYRDNCVQLEYIVKKGSDKLNLYMRVYDDGIAFRYYLPGPGSAYIEKEYTEYNLPDGTGGWGHQWVNTYEMPYAYYSPASLSAGEFSMPFLASISNNSYWALLTEANMYNANGTYCPSVLVGSTGQNMKLAFASDQSNYGGLIEAALPFQTPYRTVIITDNLNDLVNSTLVENVNPESEIADTSWIIPGRAAWSWWSEEYFGDPNVPEGYKEVSFSFERQKDYVDFAASMGWEYVTVDAGWARWTDGSIAELCQYAAAKDVGIFIWASPYVHTPYGASRMNLRKWAEWGIAGLKVDMTQNDSQVGMSFLESVADYCAELKLMVYFHNSTKPGGESRTWPNVISSEAIHGAEHYKLYWPPVPTSYHNCTLPFTRNVIGSMDYTPVALSNPNKNTSQGHQLALSVVYESAIQNFADSINIYEVWKGTEFLRCVPASWDETKLIEGFPGDYAVIARRKGNDWYIGAITVAQRTVSIPLSSLNLAAEDYTAFIYQDGASSNFLDKAECTVDASSNLTIPLLDNGGCAILISKSTVPSMPDDGYTSFEAENATLGGTATVYDNANCSNGKKVGYLGNGSGTLKFTVNVPASGMYKAKLHFLSADERWIQCSVNDEPSSTLKLRLDSGSFDVVRTYELSLNLNAGSNSIKFSHSGWAPDIDKISILIETD